MRAFFIAVIVSVLLIGVAPFSQRPNPDELTRPPVRSQSGAAQKPKPEAAPALPVVDQQEAEAMRADLARMRVLLNQMRNNLAFVQTSDTPLKHQFDLNNDMWQLLMNDMDRRLQALDRRKP